MSLAEGSPPRLDPNRVVALAIDAPQGVRTRVIYGTAPLLARLTRALIAACRVAQRSAINSRDPSRRVRLGVVPRKFQAPAVRPGTR